MSNIDNCEKADKFEVTEDNLSERVGGKLDNDFRCPITGRWVILMMNEFSEIVCMEDECPKWIEDPHNQNLKVD